ncbi:MAG: fasciclin domain-containing protein [Trueperaceae bacterium]|nr:fasciclin domain-containing protein [Trueperaceae bacterium]
MFKRSLATLIIALVPLVSAQTIVDVAADAGDFGTLVTAVQAADLAGVLSSDGPFTVFAPTDAAFAKIPADTLDAILADTELLTAILTYHVVAGEVGSDQVVGLRSAETVQGESLTVTVDGDGVRVNDANVVATDVPASNGVIHVIDTVLLPPSVTAAATDTTVLPVGSLNDSGVSGTVTIDRFMGGTLVTLSLQGTPSGGVHPAHFHAGDCTAPGSVVIPLNPVDGSTGLSVTEVDAPIEAILTDNHLVMVHLSPEEISTFVACGEVGAGAPGL